MEIPEGEGVVVAVGEEDGALRMAVAGVEDVGSRIVCHKAVAAVVVVPVLGRHQGGYG